jgi:hypothetical protein
MEDLLLEQINDQRTNHTVPPVRPLSPAALRQVRKQAVYLDQLMQRYFGSDYRIIIMGNGHSIHNG